MQKNILLEISIFFGGMFLYGLKSMIGKWMVGLVIGIGKKILIRTEHDLALYLHARNQAMMRRSK